MFFATRNLVTTAMSPVEPWAFAPVEKITAQVRGNKQDRQEWYQTASTNHQFYTPIEGLNPNLRPSRENRPFRVHGFAADYDLPIPEVRVNEAVESMKVKPSWVEGSLGGNWRLVWVLEQPILVDDFDFCAHILTEAEKWLSLDMLPGLDSPAFRTASRLYCNGCAWRATGAPAVPLSASQAFFVACGKSYRFKPAGDDATLPLDEVEAELKRRFPGFSWPADFALETQGPTFWVPDSLSPQSAIVKPGGMFTFSQHAAKPFYSWSDILGKEWAAKFCQGAIAKATYDIWWDSKRFWRRVLGDYASLDKGELTTYFKVDCKLSGKAGASGASPMDEAMNHIFCQNRITAAVPFVFRPMGPTTFQGVRMLNTYAGRPVSPAVGPKVWGSAGDFPFLSKHFESFFDPPGQLFIFLAWFQYYYLSALRETPLPGQNCFFMGGAGTGKTLTNRNIIGAAVGGFVDASDYLVDGGTFNSHLMRVPHWCLDDDAPSNSPASQARVQAMFKKVAANQQFLSNQKFEVAGMCEWMGRIGCTTNLDFVSSRIIGSLDNSSADKVNLFRCHAVGTFQFPSRKETADAIQRELPHFLKWLIDWAVPAEIKRDSRYGYAAYQDGILMDRTHQSSPTAPFKELLIESLLDYFTQNPTSKIWSGTAQQLLKMIMTNPLNDFVVRSMRLEQCTRYLEQVQKEGLIKCQVRTGPLNMRVWEFEKPAL